MKPFFVTIKLKKMILICISFFLIFMHFFCYFNFSSYKEIFNNLSNNIFNSFNNKSSQEGEENIFFVSNNNEFKLPQNSVPDLILPNTSEFVIENGVITFVNKLDLTVKCAGNGIVTKVEYLENGLKLIEIRHSGNFITRYENLKIVGVGTNFNVKNIHIIGTIADDFPLIFKIIKDNKIVQNFFIVDGEIKWTN